VHFFRIIFYTLCRYGYFFLFSQASSLPETICLSEQALADISNNNFIQYYFMVKLLNVWIKREKISVKFWREGNTQLMWIYDPKMHINSSLVVIIGSDVKKSKLARCGRWWWSWMWAEEEDCMAWNWSWAID